MNRLTALIFTIIVFSLSGASASFAKTANDQAPQAKDLSLQEMSTIVGMGRIYWNTYASYTWLFQQDSNYHAVHSAYVPPGTHDIGGHPIYAGSYVYVWCVGNGSMYGEFPMPNYDITLTCY